MKRSITFIVLMLALAAPLRAQDESSFARPMTKAGDLGFLFEFIGLDRFGISGPGIAQLNNPLFPFDSTNPSFKSGNAVGIGGKYFLVDDIALRVLLAFSNSSEGADSVKVGSNIFGIGVGAEYHFRPVFSVTPYIGAEIDFASGSFTDKHTDPNRTASTSTFGIGAFGGADWYFTNAIALGAEMGIAFSTQSGSSETTDPNTSTVQSHLPKPFATVTKSDIPSHTSIGISPASGVHLLVHF